MKTLNSRFVKVVCPKCKKEQIVFGKSATEVKCLNCGELLVIPTGGKSKIMAKSAKELT